VRIQETFRECDKLISGISRYVLAVSGSYNIINQLNRWHVWCDAYRPRVNLLFKILTFHLSMI